MGRTASRISNANKPRAASEDRVSLVSIPESAMTTLLIVDDEPTILRALEMALEMEGFTVRSANSAPEAIERLDGVDLVLTDMSMPDIDGLELLREIKKRRPELPVAIMTAYASV